MYCKLLIFIFKVIHVLFVSTKTCTQFLIYRLCISSGLICAEGDLWRDHRKFVLGFMRHHGMKNTGSRGAMEPRIHEVGVQLTKVRSLSATVGTCLFSLSYTDSLLQFRVRELLMITKFLTLVNREHGESKTVPSTLGRS